jgi:hypothetical protein
MMHEDLIFRNQVAMMEAIGILMNYSIKTAECRRQAGPFHDNLIHQIVVTRDRISMTEARPGNES